MSAGGNGPPATGGGGRARAWLAAGLAVVAALAAAAGWYAWRRGPHPPAIDLAGADPALAAAVEGARAEVVHSPRSARAWGRLGMILLAHEFGADAGTCLAEAARLDPADPRWPYLRSLPLLLSDPERGLALLERAVALGGDETAPRLRLGEELLARGRLDEAERHFRRALERQPGHARALLGLGGVAFQRGELRASREYLVRAAAGAPSAKPIHTLLAKVHRRLGDDAAAGAALGRAAGLPDGALWSDPHVEAVEELAVGIDAQLAFADRLIAQGDPGRAIRKLREAVQEYPDSYQAHWGLGHCLILVKDFEAAERALREAVRLNANGSGAWFDLGDGLRRQGNAREAAACFRQVLALLPQHAQAHYHLGLCLERLGDRPGALASLRDATRYRPNFVEGQRELGRLLAEAGRRDEAIVHLERAALLAPSDEGVRRLLERVRASRDRAGGPG